jgi:hypothetical protein
MKNFAEHEFQGYFDDISVTLVVMLDVLRNLWGKRIHVSRASGAVGREDDSNSQHNLNKWGEVRAIDILPEGIDTREEAEEFYGLCKEMGFTGIGFYPEWSKPGFHLDVRPGKYAEWGAYYDNGKQKYFSITEAFDLMGDI